MEPQLELILPNWLSDLAAEQQDTLFPTVEARMQFAIELSMRNAEQRNGPFGTAIFDMQNHRLVAAGVNLVLQTKRSIAHAEIVAITIAQQAIGNYDLAADLSTRHQLVTSAEPCCQCFGALIWSGIKSVVCGARSSDVEEIGFDEGPKPSNWVELFERRGITVQCDILRKDACKVLQRYVQQGGLIYNPAINSRTRR